MWNGLLGWNAGGAEQPAFIRLPELSDAVASI